MSEQTRNLPTSLVATPPTPAASGLSLGVTGGHGTRYPTPPFNAVICPADADPTPANAEIVRVTNIVTDTLTILRAQEGTGARTVAAGDRIWAAVTVKTITDLEALVTANAAAAVGGVLAGNLPNPSFAADMATQAELNTVVGDAASALASHGSDMTSVHGVPDTAALLSKSDTRIGFVTLRGSFGAVGNGVSDDGDELQAAFDASRALNPWMDGEGRSYLTNQPLILGPSQRLRTLRIEAGVSYAPVSTPMLLNAQGGILSFTADASTDVLTTPSNHELPEDDVQVVFKGSALPGGLTAGQTYFVRDRTATTFKVSATAGGAAVDVTSAGSGGTVYLEVSSLQKVYFDDVHIDGNGTAEVGARLVLQQQSVCRKLRIDNCTSIGLHLSGQQAIFENYQSLNNATGVALDSALFMDFYTPNIEAASYAVYVWGSSGMFGGGAFSCRFLGSHFEQNDIPNATAFDLDGQHDQLVIDGLSVSMNLNSQTVVMQYSGSPSLSGYTLRNVRVISGGALNRPTMIEDSDRGIALDSWDYFRFRLEQFHAPAKPTSDAYTDPGPITIVDPTGAMVQIGSTTPGLPRVVTPSLRLTGGTPGSGKILTSDAEGDATWQDAAASGIPGTIVDAKGDLIVATAADTVARRAIGSNGQVLTADSAEADGVKWAAASGGDAHASSHADGGADELVTALDPRTYPTDLRPEKYVTGQYYLCSSSLHGGVAGAGAQTLNRVNYTLFYVFATTTFDRIAVYTTANGSAGAVYRIGIYNDNGGVPGTVLLDAGTVATDTGANTIRAITISQALAPGRYWAAAVPQVATATVRRSLPASTGSYLSGDWQAAAFTTDSISGAFANSPTVTPLAVNPTMVGLRAA